MFFAKNTDPLHQVEEDGSGRDLVCHEVRHEQGTTAGKDLASVQAALLALASCQGSVSAGKQGGPNVPRDDPAARGKAGGKLLEEHLAASPARNLNAAKPQMVSGKLVLRPEDRTKVKNYLKYLRTQAYSVRRPCKHCHEQVGHIYIIVWS